MVYVELKSIVCCRIILYIPLFFHTHFIINHLTSHQFNFMLLA